MTRAKLLGSIGLFLCWAGLAFAQDPPPLEAPGSAPETPKATTDTTTTAKSTTNTQSNPPPQAAPSTTPHATATPSSANRVNSPGSPGSQVRPMLVIPGVTGPGSRPGVTAKGAATPLSRSPAGASAPMPADGRSPFRATTGSAPRLTSPRIESDPLSDPIPMSLEPLEDVPDSETKPRRATVPKSATDRSRTTTARSGSSRSASSPDDGADPSATNRPRQSPRLLPGMLGRILQPFPAPSRERPPEAKSAPERTKQKADSRDEPASDAVVKKKIEKQIREVLGDRVRSVEVRVSGRNVLIVAEATRFWQKRAVRRALETLPALEGYRARIDIDD